MTKHKVQIKTKQNSQPYHLRAQLNMTAKYKQKEQETEYGVFFQQNQNKMRDIQVHVSLGLTRNTPEK